MRTLVVLPTYQEAGNVAEALRRLRAAMPTAEVLVVDDDSPDGTAEVAKAVAAELGGIDVLVRPGKDGTGRGVPGRLRRRTGSGLRGLGRDGRRPVPPPRRPHPAGRGAGGQRPRHRLPLRARRVDPPVDVVAAVAVQMREPLRRRHARSGGAGHDFGLPGLPALSEVDVGRVRADGCGFQVEMVHRVAPAGGRVVEVPIRFVDRTRGDSKMSAGLVVEALALVTWWGLRERLSPKRSSRG